MERIKVAPENVLPGDLTMFGTVVSVEKWRSRSGHWYVTIKTDPDSENWNGNRDLFADSEIFVTRP